MNAHSIQPARAISLAFPLIVAGLVFAPSFAHAFAGEQPKDTRSCPKGKVWNGKKCVSANLLDDKQLIEQGRQLALAGHYDEAIGALEAVSNKDDPLALTYLGYSHRKMGDIERGMALYRQALAIKPDNIVTREYLGEGYAETGKVDLARAELAEVERLCGNTDCEEYRDLAEVIKRASAN